MDKIKCIIFDLDNTLWDGVVLEGNTALKPIVRPLLKELDDRGILMSISSKGNKDASMKELLKYGIQQYFIFPMISWQEKWRSIGQISEYTHIAVENMAFVDDSIYELEETHNYLPQINCIMADRLDMILDDQRFCVDVLTRENRNRRVYFISEMEYLRDVKCTEHNEFIRNLNMQFCFRRMKGEDLARVTELAERTKKLNTNRECKNSIIKREIVVFEYADRYFQHGIVGVAYYHYMKRDIVVDLLSISCRLLSRNIVKDIVSGFLYYMRTGRTERAIIRFRENEYNVKMRFALKALGFNKQRDGDYLADIECIAYNIPEYIRCQYQKDRSDFKE